MSKTTRNSNNCTICGEFYGWQESNLFAHLFGESLKSRVLAKNKSLTIIPSLGPITQGHLLICSNKHFLSLADGFNRGLEEIEIKSAMHTVRSWLEKYFQLPVIAFEHGSVVGGDRSSACVEHAHLHMLPLPKNLTNWLDLKDNQWTQIEKTTDLAIWEAEQTDYLFYEDTHGFKWTRPASLNYSSQFFRRQLSRALNQPSSFDWRINPNISSIIAFMEANRQNPLYLH